MCATAEVYKGKEIVFEERPRYDANGLKIFPSTIKEITAPVNYYLAKKVIVSVNTEPIFLYPGTREREEGFPEIPLFALPTAVVHKNMQKKTTQRISLPSLHQSVKLSLL